MINKIYPLLAISFPSGYKLFVVLVATVLAGHEVAKEFSQGFFWVAFLSSFTGLPIASIMMSKEYKLSLQQKYLIPIIFSVIAFLIAYAFTLKDDGAAYCVAVLLSTIFLSLYEVAKREHLNIAAFKPLLKASFATTLLFSICAYFVIDNAPLLLTMSILLFFLPLLFIDKAEDECANQAPAVGHREAISHYFKYAASNMFSTSLMCFVPLVLIGELGEDLAPQITQVFYISGVAYLIPRAMSAKHIPDMRLNGIHKHNVYTFFFCILAFASVAIFTVWQVVQYVYPESWLAFLLIFVAMQVSQLSLPFSNVLQVCGRSSTIMKINAFSSLLLALASGLAFLTMAQGYERALLLMLLFVGFQGIKLYLNHHYAAQIMNRNNVTSTKSQQTTTSIEIKHSKG
ncbi:hypothetical protein [Vibrio sp. WXL103]|uniref:hypothetical protein n=1 Tax=unclassified Vibrio TaxID=2614977 RepID=UPI003EC776A0